MPTRSSKPRDFNVLAFTTVQAATGELVVDDSDKNPAAVALGRLGGLKGGNRRAELLTAERRSEIARLAAAKRWHKSGDGS